MYILSSPGSKRLNSRSRRRHRTREQNKDIYKSVYTSTRERDRPASEIASAAEANERDRDVAIGRRSSLYSARALYIGAQPSPRIFRSV